MEKESARNQTLEQLHERRKQVVRLYRQGTKIMQIVTMTGLSYPTVRTAIDLFDTGSWGAIRPAVRGRARGDGRVLSQAQEGTIQRLIIDKRLEQLKMDFSLWSRAAVGQLTHRHRYFGVLAPNSPLRAAVTALAAVQPTTNLAASSGRAQSGSATMPGTGRGASTEAQPEQANPSAPEPAQLQPAKRRAHYLWAVLIARIYEVFPLLCPICGGQMRIIAFITHSADIRHILNHIGVDAEPPRITPARGPPLWDDCDVQTGEGVEVEPDWDEAAQPAPDDEVDQRVSW